MATEIKFGTSGWRAIVAEEFTFANIRRAVTGIAKYVAAQGGEPKVLVGRDPRVLGEVFVAEAAMPDRSGGTAVSTDEVIGTTQAPMPIPVSARARASGRNEGVLLIVASVRISPTAKVAQPPKSDHRTPADPVHRPASRDAMIISAVMGKNTSAI